MARTLARCAAIFGGFAWVGTACAALDDAAVAETHRLADAPYYVELARPQPAPGSCAIVLPIELDPELVRQFGYGDRAREFEPVLAALNARLTQARDGSCVRAATQPIERGRAPRVYVGSAESDYAPPEGEQQRLDTDRFPPMILHVERPDAAWREALSGRIVAADAPYAIQVQLGVSQYMKGYSSAFRKEVVLGTGHRQPIKFLTAEDKPVEVLHLTGLLVDATGRPVLAGAEGIVLRDTPFLAQALDAQRTLDDEEIARVLATERRRDLPGEPLKLDVALDNLLAQLTRGAVQVPAR